MRKNRAEKREIIADPIYNSKLITKVVNGIMIDGKKGTAQKILYRAFDKIAEVTGKDAFEIFTQAIENITPQIEVKARRVGGANYQVPVEVRDERKQTLALRWLVNYSKIRNEKTMIERLAKEIIDASNNTGGAVKKKEDTHRMADANKAFSHFRF